MMKSMNYGYRETTSQLLILQVMIGLCNLMLLPIGSKSLLKIFSKEMPIMQCRVA